MGQLSQQQIDELEKRGHLLNIISKQGDPETAERQEQLQYYINKSIDIGSYLLQLAAQQGKVDFQPKSNQKQIHQGPHKISMQILESKDLEKNDTPTILEQVNI